MLLNELLFEILQQIIEFFCHKTFEHNNQNKVWQVVSKNLFEVCYV